MNPADRHPSDAAGLPGWIERARLADQSWPVVLVVAASSVAIPWYFGWQPYDLRPMLLTLLAVGVFCYSATQLIARWTPVRFRNAAYAAVFLATVLVLALVWHGIGALGEPTFVIVFALPIVAASFVSRGWLQLVVALIAVTAVWTTAIVNSVDLRWQAEQLGLPPFWNVFGVEPQAGRLLQNRPTQTLQHLVIATLGLAGLAVVSSLSAGLVGGLYRRLAADGNSILDAAKLAGILTADAQAPVAVVVRDTGEVLSATDALAELAGRPADALRGRPLASVIEFAAPEIVERQITSGETGSLRQNVATAQGDALFCVDIEAFALGPERVARVSLRHPDEDDYAAIACASLDQPVLVVDDAAVIRFVTGAFAALADGFAAGRSIAGLSDRLDLPAGWWEIAPRERHERPVSLGEKNYRATIRRIRPFGQEPLTVILLQEGGRS